MKLVSLVLVALLVGCAFTAQVLTRGDDLKKYLEGGKDGTFIILFYDREAPQIRTEEMRNQIRSKILNNNPNFNYYEVDVQEREYDTIVDGMMKIDREEVKYSPTILVASEGRGYWAHGDSAVDDIAYHLPEYSIDYIRASRQK